MFDNNKISQQHGQSGTVTKGEWFKCDLLLLIPFAATLVGGLLGGLLQLPVVGAAIAGIGYLATLVLYIVIAVSRKTAPSLRNRVQLSLIYMLVSIVLGIVISVLVIVPNLGTIEAQYRQMQEAQNAMQALNSGDYSSLYGQYGNSTTGDLTPDDINSMYGDYLNGNGSASGYGSEDGSYDANAGADHSSLYYGDNTNGEESGNSTSSSDFDDSGLFSNSTHF